MVRKVSLRKTLELTHLQMFGVAMVHRSPRSPLVCASVLFIDAFAGRWSQRGGSGLDGVQKMKTAEIQIFELLLVLRIKLVLRFLMLPKTCDAAKPVMVHGGNSHALQAYLDAPLDDMLMRCLISCVCGLMTFPGHVPSMLLVLPTSRDIWVRQIHASARNDSTIQMLCLYCTHMLGGHKHLLGCWTSRTHSPGLCHPNL